MSGDAPDTTTTLDTPAVAAPVSTPLAADTSTAPLAGATDVLTANSTERKIIIMGATVTFGLSVLGIIGSLCYLVVRDGNSALVSDVTGKLAWVAIAAILTMTAALFGQTQLLGKFVDKVL